MDWVGSHCCCTLSARTRYCSATTDSGSVHETIFGLRITFLLRCGNIWDHSDGRQCRERPKIVECSETSCRSARGRRRSPRPMPRPRASPIRVRDPGEGCRFGGKTGRLITAKRDCRFPIARDPLRGWCRAVIKKRMEPDSPTCSSRCKSSMTRSCSGVDSIRWAYDSICAFIRSSSCRYASDALIDPVQLRLYLDVVEETDLVLLRLFFVGWAATARSCSRIAFWICMTSGCFGVYRPANSFCFCRNSSSFVSSGVFSTTTG